MPGNPREIITAAERRFPVRIRIGLPPNGFGQRHTAITAWLDENCGADGWAMTPSGMRGVVNDAVSIYFLEAMPTGLEPATSSVTGSVKCFYSKSLNRSRHRPATSIDAQACENAAAG